MPLSHFGACSCRADLRSIGSLVRHEFPHSCVAHPRHARHAAMPFGVHGVDFSIPETDDLPVKEGSR
jgi:hypothetical protein